ncbi:MAG: hypothetical protein A2W26_00975 [Acidobacteria bacterium RBG_16_64_8]|nr:MAG: hypothetical protein A2W26_00975 [Acidobacteria bacterium RBG_16_64_8]
MAAVANRGIPVRGDGSGFVVLGPRHHRRRFRRFPFTRHLMWSGMLRVIQRLTHCKRGDRLEFEIGFSVRDLLSDKGRAVKDQVEALVQAVQKAGSYQAKDEANRAMRAVMDVLKDRVPPDVLMKLSESLPVREAARLRRAAAQRVRKGDGEKSEAGIPR